MKDHHQDKPPCAKNQPQEQPNPQIVTFQHPDSVLHRLTPTMGWPSIEASYESEVHQRLWTVSDFISDNMTDNSDVHLWPSDALRKLSAILIHIDLATDDWHRSQWEALMIELYRADAKIEALNGLVRQPT